jgi:hypothetical protein
MLLLVIYGIINITKKYIIKRRIVMSKIPDNIKKMWEEAASKYGKNSRGKDSNSIGKIGDKDKPSLHQEPVKKYPKPEDKK